MSDNKVIKGKNCIGFCNTGNWNAGNRNAGNRNAGNRNAGDQNTGNWNTGDQNTGNWNAGYWNAGYCNTGDQNIGHRNTGNCNTGDRNTGNCNTGYRNTGDCNNSNYNNGCFNTKSTKIYMFNKLSNWIMEDWLDSEARKILLNNVLVHPTDWVEKSDMTDDEKRIYPDYSITEGYLKILSQEEIFYKQQKNWSCLNQREKEIVMALPNFDKVIFKEITGIDVEK